MIQFNKNSSFKVFLLKLLAFFITVYLLDFVIGQSLRKFYYKQESGYDYLTTYSIDKAKADIMVFGSSRAVNIFNTKIFEDSTGLTCFNTGRYGEPIFYHYAVLKSVLKRYQPKIIILSFDAGNFSKNVEAYDRLTALLPYYKDHPEIRPVVALKGPYEKLKMISNIYPYNSLLMPIITGNTAYSKKKYPHINGFIPIKRTFAGPLQTFDYSKETGLDTVKINSYRSFIQDCVAANIELHIVCPPYLIHAIGTDRSIIEGKRIAAGYNISFLDYSRDSFFIDKPQLFADYRHLNETGVALFSNKVIKEMGISKL
ncbi:MAG: hypothetical protein ABIQ31_22195 [Ferruginibacter sp.]